MKWRANQPLFCESQNETVRRVIGRKSVHRLGTAGDATSKASCYCSNPIALAAIRSVANCEAIPRYWESLLRLEVGTKIVSPR